jgi:hypothetical protein
MNYPRKSNAYKTKRGSSRRASFDLLLQRRIRSIRGKERLIHKDATISNFSEVETGPSAAFEIQKLVREAGQAAASEAKAVGIPKVFAKDNRIYREYPDGKMEIVVEVKGETEFFILFKGGTLHARKK